MKQTPRLLLTLASALLSFSVGAQTFTGANVGTPALAGSHSGTAPGAQTITGGGNDIWGTSDNFYFYYATISGQVWDAKVKVTDLQGPDGWTKCELMLRVPDASGTAKGPDPFIAMMTTRAAGQNEVGPQYRAARGGDAGNANFGFAGGTVRPSYPNTWLRITRVGSVFTLYFGTDGTAWTKYCDINTAASVNGFGTPFPDKLLVGVAVTAHNDGDTTGGVASISDLGVTVTPTASSLAVVTQVQNASAYVGCDAFFSFGVTNKAIANGFVPGYQWYKNDVAMTNATAARCAFLTAASDNNAKIYCKAYMPDASLYSATGTVTVLPATEYAGKLKYQVWPGQSLGQIVGADYAKPSPVSTRDSFEAPWDWGGDFAARLSGYFIPPTTGDYVFFVCSDDNSDLYISTDENPANARLVAQEVSWSGRNKWVSTGDGNNTGQKRSDAWSPDGGTTYPWSTGIHLEATKKYFIAGVMREGGGGDNLSAFWKLVSDADPADDTPSNFTNGLIAALSWPATTLTITDQPDPVTVFEGLDASLKVTVSTDGEMTPLYQWQMHGTNLPGKTSSTLAFTPASLANSGPYKCVITQPLSALTVTSDEVTVTVQASVFVTGIVKQEIWGPNDTGPTRDGVVAGTDGEPDTKGFISAFDTSDWANDYVQRLSTWFTPPQNGNYVFFVCADDIANVYLSTDDDPVNKRMIAQETTWSGNHNYLSSGGGSSLAQKRSDQFVPADATEPPFAAGIPLVTSQKYYLEAVHEEGGGGDNLAVYFMLVGGTEPANGTVSNLRGDRIGAKLPAPTYLTIMKQPQSTTAHGWDQAIFAVDATTDALYPPTYQWRRGGVPIPNATGKSYSLITSTNDNGAVFDCVVSLSQFGTSNSLSATLTVLGDAVYTPGFVKEEYFSGVSYENVIAGNVGEPTQPVALWTIFESRTNITDVSFTRRVTGLFTPAVSGDYVFFTASDDQSKFYISTNDQPRGKRLVCEETSWNAARVWSTCTALERSDLWTPDGGTTTPWAAGIPLLAGNRYYIEAVMAEGSGGDNLAVTYKLITEADPADGDAPLLTGNVIGYMAAPARPEITSIKLNADKSITITWTGGGTLQAATDLTGPWQDVTSTSPYTFTPQAGVPAMFGRIRK